MTLSLQAQSRVFKKGQLDANFGIGLLPTFTVDNGKTILLPLSISADYRLAGKFSMGLYAGKSITETKRTDIQDCPNAHWKNNWLAWQRSFHEKRKAGYLRRLSPDLQPFKSRNQRWENGSLVKTSRHKTKLRHCYLFRIHWHPSGVG